MMIMKNLFIGKYFAIALCLLSVQSLMAKDIYLSVSGADTNNGLSESRAVATLTKALSLIEEGDNIRVSGIIDVSKDVSGKEGVDYPICQQPEKKVSIGTFVFLMIDGTQVQVRFELTV